MGIIKSVSDRIWKNDQYHIIQYTGQPCTKELELPEGLTFEILNEDHFSMLIDNWPVSVSYLVKSKEDIITLLNNRLSKNDSCIICFIGNKFVGMSWLSIYDMHMLAFLGKTDKTNYCWKNLFVEPEYRRAGVAIASYNFAIDTFKQYGGKQLLGFVQEGNVKSINFTTKSLGAVMIGKLLFKIRFNFRYCYFEDTSKQLTRLPYPKKGKYLQ